MVRAFVILILSLTALLLPAQHASAAGGVKRIGQIVKSAQPVPGETGSCVCEWNTYTVGLHAGKVRIDALVKSFSSQESQNYQVTVILEQGTKPLKRMRITCSASQLMCNKTSAMKVTVPHKGIYYLVVQGTGADGISYVFRLRGKMAPMRCSKMCSLA